MDLRGREKGGDEAKGEEGKNEGKEYRRRGTGKKVNDHANGIIYNGVRYYVNDLLVSL